MTTRRRLRTSAASGAAALSLLGHLLIFLRLLPNRDRIPTLADWSAPSPPAHPPRLSVIVPARDEGGTLRAAATSALAQDYPELELVLIDDRSTDDTGRVIAGLARAHPDRVRPLSVEALPPGWLGKSHALWLGARRATGDWLLFADADITFAPDCFRRAIGYAEANGLDHLTLFPRVTARGYWLGAFVAFFSYVFVAMQRPYLANDPCSPVGIGIGAFNLIRREAYQTLGTHAALALRPDDDMRLGLRVKRLGLRQRAVLGAEFVRVEWYPSLSAALRGLEKNIYAGFEYRIGPAVAVILAGWLLMVAPYLGLWRAPRGARRFLAGAIAIHSLNYLAVNYRSGWQVILWLPALPATGTLFWYAVARAVWLTLRRGGIRWRETFYPLPALRAQTGLEGTPPRSAGVFTRGDLG